MIQDLLVVSTTLDRSSRLSDGLDRLDRLKAGEGRESTGGDNRADARSDGDDTLEHFEGVCVCVYVLCEESRLNLVEIFDGGTK